MGALAFLFGPIGRTLLIAFALAVALGGAWWRGHSGGLSTGRAEVQSRWDAEKLKQQDAALKAEAANRAKEQGMAASVAAVADHYSKESARAKTENADLRRKLADGSVRLTVPGACPGGGGAPAPSGSAGGGDGRTDAELPAAIAATLSAIGAEADEVARQLGACQAILRSERNQ